MSGVRVTHGIGQLAADMAAIPPRAMTDMVTTTQRNVEQGKGLARGIARRRSGRHGKHYYKRITSEMTAPLVGEYGPNAGGPPIGGGWRHGPGNNDLAKSADIQGPRFADDVAKLPDGWFW